MWMECQDYKWHPTTPVRWWGQLSQLFSSKEISIIYPPCCRTNVIFPNSTLPLEQCTSLPFIGSEFLCAFGLSIWAYPWFTYIFNWCFKCLNASGNSIENGKVTIVTTVEHPQLTWHRLASVSHHVVKKQTKNIHIHTQVINTLSTSSTAAEPITHKLIWITYKM